MKLLFESDNDLSLGKVFSINSMVIAGFAFQEGSKYYLQVLLHEFA